MGELRKITAFVPSELLAKAQDFTGAGVAETLKIALERLSREHFYATLRQLRGRVQIGLNLDDLREDREFDIDGNVRT